MQRTTAIVALALIGVSACQDAADITASAARPVVVPTPLADAQPNNAASTSSVRWNRIAIALFRGAIIACFDTKFTYWFIRPSQADPTITLATGLCDRAGGEPVPRPWRTALSLRWRGRPLVRPFRGGAGARAART